MAWAARITSIAISMVVPGLVGYYADTYFGTKAMFTLLGFGFGMTAGIWQLVQAAQPRK